VTARVTTGLGRLDEMLGGGLLPGTLCVVYGATGIGKTHLGLTFAHAGVEAEGAPGILFDMNSRGDSQQHHEYAARLYDWSLQRWRHTVTPMAAPFPPPGEMAARFCDALAWTGKLRDYQVPAPDGGLELDWNWKAEYNHALYTVRPFVYFHLGAGCRRIVVDGVEPMDVPGDYMQPFVFDELYRKVIHRDSETLIRSPALTRQRERLTLGSCPQLARPQAAPDRLAQPPGRGAVQLGHLRGQDGQDPPGLPGDRRGQRAGERRDGLLHRLQQRGQLA